MSVLLVTAADAKYFELVQGVIRSVREKPQGRGLAIAVLDLGLTFKQVDVLRQQVEFIFDPPWEHSFPPSAQIPSHYRALFSRPYFRQYFPGFDTYFWIDADAWVEDWSAVDLFLRGAAKRGMAVVQEIDRSNRVICGGLAGVMKEWNDWYGSHFGPEMGRTMMNYPMINAGVYALRHDAPHWELWRDRLAAGLKVSCSNLADQLALNVVIYREGMLRHTELLPAWCNWMCHCCLPAWDPVAQRLVEPYLPHTPIGILHLSGEKRETAVLESTLGAKVSVRLRFPTRRA